MSWAYDNYLYEHRNNVRKGIEWILSNLNLVSLYADSIRELGKIHDESKNNPDEYKAYDEYFYGNNRSNEVVEDFNKAWLLHIHRNPHHWQYWVLINDDPELGEICIEMPANYVVEMIADWWSFSWKVNNLYEIFKWYELHKDHIKLHENTRKLVESILKHMKEKLDSESDVSES